MGHHHHDHEERVEVSAVVAWLDAGPPWYHVLVYKAVAGEPLPPPEAKSEENKFLSERNDEELQV